MNIVQKNKLKRAMQLLEIANNLQQEALGDSDTDLSYDLHNKIEDVCADIEMYIDESVNA